MKTLKLIIALGVACQAVAAPPLALQVVPQAIPAGVPVAQSLPYGYQRQPELSEQQLDILAGKIAAKLSVQTQVQSQVADPNALFQSKCVRCHDGNNATSFAGPIAELPAKLRAESIIRMLAEPDAKLRMPKGGTLELEEYRAIVRLLVVGS